MAGIVDYLKKQSGPASTKIKFADEPTSFVGENKVVIVSNRLFCFRFISSHIDLFIISSYVFKLEFSRNFLERSLTTFLP